MPGEPLAGKAQRRARIIEREDLTIRTPRQTHLFRAALAQADTVSLTGAFEYQTAARGGDFISITANGIPSQFAADREAE